MPSHVPFIDNDVSSSNRVMADWLNDVNNATYNGTAVYTPAGTGAVATTVQAKLRESVSVKDFGAVGNGVADDTAAINAALASSAGGLELFFPAGTYKVTSTIVLPTGRDFRLYGTGTATDITSTGLSAIFERNTRGSFVEIDSIAFTGTSPAFLYDAPGPLPWTDTLYEYKITNCRFFQTAGTYHIKLIGAREGMIQNCYFQNGDGVYASYSINLEFHSCMWKDTLYGVRSDIGTEGVRLVGCTMLGCGKGVYFTGGTGLLLTGTIIDFCDLGVHFDSSASLIITGSYLSSRTVNAALLIDSTTAPSTGIQIVGNVLRQNSTTALNKIIEIYGVAEANIISNTLENYRTNGIEYTTSTYLNISYNRIRKNPAYAGNYSISATVDSSTNKIHDNVCDNIIVAPLTVDLIGNTGQAIADTQFGSWVVTMTSFTVVGSPIATGRYVRNGKLVTCWATLNPNGGTIASIAATSLLQGLPFTPTMRSTCTVSDDLGTSVGIGLVNVFGLVYTPAWVASGVLKTVQFSYYIG